MRFHSRGDSQYHLYDPSSGAAFQLDFKISLKLKQFGVKGPFYQWCDSYLTNRSQRVVINGCESQLVNIDAGVPPGSISGPLFFLVFINDIISELETDPHLFADDTFLLDVFCDPAESVSRLNWDFKKIIQRPGKSYLDARVKPSTRVTARRARRDGANPYVACDQRAGRTPPET